MNAVSIFSALGVLASVVGLVLLAGRIAMRFPFRSQSGPGRSLALRESIALDTKRRGHLLQCGDRQVVLLTGGSQDIVVGWMNQS